MSHVSKGQAKDVESVPDLLNQSTGICLCFEVTNEMKANQSCFSQSVLPSVYGTNFVLHSHIPKQIFKTGKKMEGLRKIKKVSRHFCSKNEEYSISPLLFIIILLF